MSDTVAGLCCFRLVYPLMCSRDVHRHARNPGAYPRILIQAKGENLSENPTSVRRPIHEEVEIHGRADCVCVASG